MRENFENYLSTLIDDEYSVNQSMNYSFLAKSKRVRPLLLLSVLKDLGIDEKIGYPAASAIEMVHTYSLIHDDLPAFDNDDFRRGKPTNHKVYGEEVAILAGDALLTKSFETIADGNYPGDIAIKLVKTLSDYAGHNGMIKGQQLDKDFETSESISLEQLIEMDNLKTGRLLTAPFVMGLTITKREEYVDTFIQIGNKLGIAFQIQDDILDVTSNQETLGKSISDSQNNKTTYVTLLGLEKAKERVDLYFSEIETLINSFDEDFANTKQIILSLLNRTW